MQSVDAGTDKTAKRGLPNSSHQYLHNEQQSGGHSKHAHPHKCISVSIKPAMHTHKVFHTHAQHSTCMWLCSSLACLSIPQLLTSAIKMELTHLGLCLLILLHAYPRKKVPASLETIRASPLQSPDSNGKGKKERERKKITLMIRFG